MPILDDVSLLQRSHIFCTVSFLTSAPVAVSLMETRLADGLHTHVATL